MTGQSFDEALAESATSTAPAPVLTTARRPDALKLAQQYATLAEDKRSLFRTRVRAQGLDADAIPVVPLVPRPARFPLLFAQERLWFLWCLDPQHAGYHITHTLRLSGTFDVAALHRALTQLVLRHEALRLRFDADNGVPMQYPHADASYGFTQRTITDDGVALEEVLRDFACEPFDLVNGPVLRVGLFETGDAQRVLQFVVHHIVADAWSMDVLFRDLLALYHGERNFPALPVQLADVALWQREWAGNALLEEQIAYWRERLAGAPAELTLPRDLPPRAMRSHDGGLARLSISAALADSLRAIARNQRTTLFTLLLAVFDVLLCRYSGQRTVVVGVPTAGRERTELEGLVGFFVNTLIVRADLDGAQPFDALLRNLHERVLEAQAHRDVPFARLVEALSIERNLDSSPLFQVMFDLAADSTQAQRATRVGSDGLIVESLLDVAPTARFDLALNGRDRGAGDTLQLALTYSRDRFVETTARRLLDDYAELLEQIAVQPARKVGDLAVRHERSDARPNITREPFSAVHERIAERARQYPARVALRCEGAALTYAKLDAWAERIALALRADGLVAGERVGLLLERSLALPAALLGVFKAGGAFVPLDPEYPRARLQAMIVDAGVARVVVDDTTRVECRDLLKPLRTVLASSEGESKIDALTSWDVHPDSLAYVIYTSGSTGTPKGVAISHRSLALHLEDFLHEHRITESGIVLQSSTINFDVALHEFLPALMMGGRVVMRGPQQWELASLNRTLCDEQVTFARIPTALWQQWRIALPPANRIALRQITVGGEALPGDALQRWYEGPLAHVAIDNLYGPTETTVAALHHPVSHADAQQAIVAIGRCYPARHAYVADLDGNRAPDGALGELCIGGPTLAQGYFARPALTAERFVPDPYGAPGSRVYRSGDLCRARVDGIIDFLGRIDQQVKLRGHRIELGEIEVALRRIDKIREAVVDLRGDGERKRLVAYFTGPANPDAVREELARTLPASHVPSICVALEALPTLPNGKLDRRALPEPDDVLQRAEEPDGDVETALLAVWQTVLGRDDFGVTDNFFTLGGDSISSLRVIAQARAIGWTVSARQVFEHPTVRGLAIVARAVVAAAESEAAVSEPLEVPLAPMQRWFFERYPHAPARWNQSVLLRSADALDANALRAAFDALLVAHDALRASFRRDPRTDEWTQTILPPLSTTAARDTLSFVDLREATDPAAAIESQADRMHDSLDLAAGKLLHAAYMMTPDGARLLIVIHHLVVDGVSWRILLDDLLSAYESARACGMRPMLPRPGTTWREWSQRLAEYASLPEHLSELAWWQKQLEAPGGAQPVTFAQSTPRRTLDRNWTLDAPTTRRLTDSGRRVDEVLLAALSQALADHVPQVPPIVELEGHGRRECAPGLDLSRTVGWFTTQYPLRLIAASQVETTYREIAALLQTVPAEGMHFNLFRYAGRAPTRAVLEALPRSTIGFNYLGRFEERLSEGRFTFATEDSGNGMDANVATAARHVLDLNGLIANGCLKVEWSAAQDVLDAPQLERLIATFEEHLRALVCSADRHANIDARAVLRQRLFDGLSTPAHPHVSTDDDPAQQGAFELWRERFHSESLLCPSYDAVSDAGLQPLNAGGAPLTLFCFYPGFGLVGEYRFLAAALQGVASVLALRSPGFMRDEKESADDFPATFEALAEACVERVLTVQPEGPFRLLGWSFGGRLAVAVAALLRARGHAVDFLGLLDTATHTAEAPLVESSEQADLPTWLDQQADGAQLRVLFERASELDALHYRLRVAHTLPTVDVPIAFWRAGRDTAAGRRRDWRAYTSAAVEEVLIDASHTGIVHHPALHDSVRDRLKRLLTAPTVYASQHEQANIPDSGDAIGNR
ncbi:non-ribosomal peptide synthetase [Paraburkholderia sp. BCC1885]|uniref:non-ribosomal peptide synthetase n=1 Tax=Paraburkholderia sp. BCC1885 TaxID=2562669 RepID=UPI0011834B71|nr:non-ribosomal peptide synthetase [Paraburkholderia sp. BCC1885]